MKELFYEILGEARDGRVLIDDEIWPIGFNSQIYHNGQLIANNFSDDNLTTLVINDEDAFFTILDQYLKLCENEELKFVKAPRDRQKFVLSYLFVNATTEDFANPIAYIDRRMQYMKDTSFKDLDGGVEILLAPYHLKVKNEHQSIMMETPNKVSFTITSSEGHSYHLPSISYGMTMMNGEKYCDIYSILKPKEQEVSTEEERFRKRISRKLYKLNNGVSALENPEYLDYLNNDRHDDYYPENISDVSVSAVLALSTFINLLRNREVDHIRAVPYLPLRYLSRYLASKDVDDQDLKSSLEGRNQNIQTNITDKFIRTFRRVAHHFDDLKIVSYPYENDEFLHLELGDEKVNKNI